MRFPKSKVVARAFSFPLNRQKSFSFARILFESRVLVPIVKTGMFLTPITEKWFPPSLFATSYPDHSVCLGTSHGLQIYRQAESPQDSPLDEGWLALPCLHTWQISCQIYDWLHLQVYDKYRIVRIDIDTVWKVVGRQFLANFILISLKSPLCEKLKPSQTRMPE